MVLTLVGVVMVIRSLDGESMNKVFHALGIDTASSDAPGLRASVRPLFEGEEKFNLCPTRIHAIEWSSGRKIEEHKEGLKMKWMAQPDNRELGYLAIEKWLSYHCQVAVRPFGPGEGVQGAPDTTIVHFIDGSKLEIKRFAEDQYMVGDRGFRSADLKKALEGLQKLAWVE